MDPLVLAQTISTLSTVVLEISARIGVTEQEVPEIAKLKDNVRMLNELPDLPTSEPSAEESA